MLYLRMNSIIQIRTNLHFFREKKRKSVRKIGSMFQKMPMWLSTVMFLPVIAPDSLQWLSALLRFLPRGPAALCPARVLRNDLLRRTACS